jgi:hypothetical protein
MDHKPFFIALLGLILATSAQAQWKWKDAKGNLQFSDRPPPSGTPDKDILQRPGNAVITIVPVGQAASASAAPASAPIAPTKAELEAAARRKQEQEREAARQKEEARRIAEQRRDNCNRAQSNLRELQSGVRMSRTNEAGERVFLDDAQRQVELDRVRGTINTECR